MLQAGGLPDQAPDDAEDADGLRARAASGLGSRAAEGLGPSAANRPGRAWGVAGAPGAGSEGERLAAFDEAVAEITARVESAYGQADGWLEQTRAGLTELLRFCDEQPETARALVIDSIAWGSEVLERRGRLLDALVAALDWGRAEGADAAASRGAGRAAHLSVGPAAPAESPALVRSPGTAKSPVLAPPAGTAENLVGACVSLVHTRLLQAPVGSLFELAPALMSLIIHPYLGAGAARRELERPLADAGAEPAERELDRSFSATRKGTW